MFYHIITLGAGVDNVVLKGIVAATNGDTITGFKASGADTISLGTGEATFIAKTAFQDVTTIGSKVTFNTSTSNVLEFSSEFTGKTLASSNDGTALLALVSSGIDVTVTGNKGYIVAYQDGNAYLYYAQENLGSGTADTALEAADIVLVGVFNGVAAGSLGVADINFSA